MSKDSKLYEKHQTILADVLREEENKQCADCLAKGPRWASWNLGVFVCIRCAGIHRNLGVHISRVKSVNLDSWTPEQIQAIQNGGNRLARDKYEGNLPANFRRPVDDYAVEQFIRNKYERKLYLSKQSGTSPTTAAKTSKVKKEVKKSELKPSAALTRPSQNSRRSPSPKSTNALSRRSQSARRSPSPQPKATSAPVTRNPSPQPDLIALETAKTTPTAVDLLTNRPNPQATKPVSQSQPLLMMEQQPSLMMDVAGGSLPSQQQQPGNVKDSIMSLYNVPPIQSYTAQGYPGANSIHYQRQAASMVQQERQSAAMAQVQQVQQQMRSIKQQTTVNGGGGGGQTLNPHLW